MIQISGEGIEEADLITVAQERSAAYTASHLGALLRAAQLAVALGADLPALADVPDAVEDAFRAERDPCRHRRVSSSSPAAASTPGRRPRAR